MLPRIEVTGRVESVSLRVTGTGKSVLNFTVASHKLRRRNDQWQETDRTLIRCVAWDRLAETASDALDDGIEVTVIGELKQLGRRNDGEPAGYEVTAKHVSLALPVRSERVRPVEDPDDPWVTSPPPDPWANQVDDQPPPGF